MAAVSVKRSIVSFTKCIFVKEGNNSEFPKDGKFRIPLMKSTPSVETSYSFVKV